MAARICLNPFCRTPYCPGCMEGPGHTVLVAVYVRDDGTDVEGLLTAIEARENVRAAIDLTEYEGTGEREVTVLIPAEPTDDGEVL